MGKYLCLLFAAFIISTSSKAAPGDTTWVQGNITNLDSYGSYDSAITFPSGSVTYRKIYMTFTLGKHTCPGYNYACGNYGNPPCPAGDIPWCGDWDYTVQNYLMTPGGDTLEIARFITPYANAGAPRTPYTWTQRYTYDVTDYAALLKDLATMRIFYSGYSGGFTANIQFMFIEGTPDRNVVGIRKLWNGSYTYGDTAGADAGDINTHFTPLMDTAPTGTATTDLKFTVTGHGSDANQCCEFMSHNYQVMLNGSSAFTHTIWRDNCGLNELYPQSGTWLLERGNWCPGAMVYSNYYALPGITAGSAFNVGLNFDSYIGAASSSGWGSYTTFGTLIYYGPINKTLDASIEEVIAPSNNENFFRENPVIGSPIINIKNSGATTIDSVTFQYGIKDSAMQTYTWVGTLSALKDTEINLAPLLNLNTIAGLSGTYNFVVNILRVNGVTDADVTNNTMTSQFVAAPSWPSSFKVLMKTSNVNSYSSPSLAQTSWVIYNKSDNSIVKQRANCALSTVYADTLNLPTGFYQLAIYDSAYSDGNYYGINWWALAGSGYSPGYIYVKRLTGANINMNGYNYSGEYAGDFGQGFTQDFYVLNTTESTTNITNSSAGIDAYPNPAQSVVNVDISGLQNVRGKIVIMDMVGRTVSETICNAPSQQVNVENLANGVYSILFISNDGSSRLQKKLLIAK